MLAQSWSSQGMLHPHTHIFYGKCCADKAYNLLKVEELSTLSPKFDWVGFVTETLAKVGMQVCSNETVIVRTPYYFSNLSVLFNATEERWGDVCVRKVSNELFCQAELGEYNSLRFVGVRYLEVVCC